MDNLGFFLKKGKQMNGRTSPILGFNFINVFCALFSHESLFLAAFSSFILALAKKFVQKTRAFNVDEIDGRPVSCQQQSCPS